MKKRIAMLLSITLMLTLAACGDKTTPNTSGDTAQSKQNEVTTEIGSDSTEESASQEESTSQNESVSHNASQTMTISEFEKLLSEQPLYVSETDYIVQDDKYKNIYPDALQAIITNDTTEDIKDAVVAFAAWDSNNLPVKIKGQFDFTDGVYIKQVSYDDINLIGGDSYGENSGYSLEENSNIAAFKAIVVSFETFDGDKWKNPYFDEFCKMYEGKKYSDSMTVDVKVVDSAFSVSEKNAGGSSDSSVDSSMTADELDSNLSTQPLTIISTDYVVQDDKYKSLYPDMLQVVMKNNTEDDIKDAIVAFAAWDSNGLPVKITGQFDIDDGSYVKKVNCSDINLAAGGTYGEDKGYSLNEHSRIKTFKAIVVSYETFDGDTWKNPYFKDFCKLYEGKKQK